MTRVKEDVGGPPKTGLSIGEVIESAEFRRLVTRRWRVALALAAVLFVVYYGFILLVALRRDVLATRIGDTTTLGIVFGAAVIVFSWLLTGAYVVWANREYDPEVQRLRALLRR